MHISENEPRVEPRRSFVFLNRWIWNPPWKTIRMLGALPVLGVSFTTLLATPVLARVIHHLRESLENLRSSLPPEHSWLNDIISNFDSSLHLPLVLKILCASAIFAAIGKAIYLIRCPIYFKEALSFDDFVRSVPFAHSILATEFIQLWNDSTESFRSAYIEEIDSSDKVRLSLPNHSVIEQARLTEDMEIEISGKLYSQAREEIISNLVTLIRTPSFGQSILGVLRIYRDNFGPWSRRLCAWTYYVALGLFLWALSLQLKWVLLELFA